MEVEPRGYRCRVGHAWPADALLEAKGSAWERAFLAALRSLGERVGLARRMAKYARERGGEWLAERYQQAAAEATSAGVLRKHLTAGLTTEASR